MNSASHSTSSLSHKSQCVIVDNTSELTRAEKLKLWQSMKSTSSSSLSSSCHNGNGQKRDFASSSTVTVPSTFKLSNRKNNPNGTVKSILFKKKNYKKYRNSFHENTILEQYSPQSQPEKPDSKAPQLSQTENDEENNCPNETPDDQSTKLVTPLKKKKVLSTHSSQPSPYLDGYLTANDESSSRPASPTPPSPTPPVPSSVSASSFFMTKTLEKLQQDNLHLKTQLRRSTEIQNESVAIAKMSQQEIECLNFANDILTQKCNEIEEQLTRERMRYHEKDNHRIDKYREEIKSLKAKNSEYERRANEMVTEMNQQMSQLQDMAMTRIESLEKELLLEQHKSETLQNSIQKLSLQNVTKDKYVRRRTNTLISSSTPCSSSSIVSPLPVSKGRRRGSKQRRSKLSTETLSEESSGDEDDSLTVGSNSDEENDQLNLMPLTFQTSPHTAHPLTQTEGEEETEEAEEDEEESRYGKYN